MSQDLRQEFLDLANSPKFVDKTPAEIYHYQLDHEGKYTCSMRSMYRILADSREVRERRNLRRHPVYARPELLATAPRQLWSWDITKLRGPCPGVYFQLYVVIDVFSRFVVGWLLDHCESDDLAKTLLGAAIRREGILPHDLTIHADHGPAMKSKLVSDLYTTLGVTKSHSRPYVSDDNPYIESHFKTLKYRPAFPDRFGSIQDARAFCRDFFVWYNTEHYHSGIKWLTPTSVHHGLSSVILAKRQEILVAQYEKTPRRFINGMPKLSHVPEAVWINRPAPVDSETPNPIDTGVIAPPEADKSGVITLDNGPANSREVEAQSLQCQVKATLSCRLAYPRNSTTLCTQRPEATT